MCPGNCRTLREITLILMRVSSEPGSTGFSGIHLLLAREMTGRFNLVPQLGSPELSRMRGECGQRSMNSARIQCPGVAGGIAALRAAGIPVKPGFIEWQWQRTDNVRPRTKKVGKEWPVILFPATLALRSPGNKNHHSAAERCWSGRTGLPAKQLHWQNRCRGFESPPLRHPIEILLP